MKTELEVNGPSYAGDTIHVLSRVTELKATSKLDCALGRFHNEVVNQDGKTVLAYSELRTIKLRLAEGN